MFQLKGKDWKLSLKKKTTWCLFEKHMKYKDTPKSKNKNIETLYHANTLKNWVSYMKHSEKLDQLHENKKNLNTKKH